MMDATASRRTFIKRVAATLLLAAPLRGVRAETPRFRSNPFLLGVASGYPTPQGFVLWTRLIASLSDPRKDLPDAVPVLWEVATDAQLRNIVARGTDYATHEFAHSVHVEVGALASGRDYWYRFTAGGVRSPVGHTRTAPAIDAEVMRLRIAVASCQKYESGNFAAYRHLRSDRPDLVIHVGDYIYEYASPTDAARRGDGSGEARTLDEYRARYALYKSDPDLQAAHAACPWLVTWDDHEVVNDYSGDASYEQSGESFLARRAAAYRAYYEHMPLPRSAMPNGPAMRLHTQCRFGTLLQIHMLDGRQYRSPLACLGDDSAAGGGGAHCAALFDEARTLLGAEQERWLRQQLIDSRARWNVLAQGTPMTHTDMEPGPGVAYRRDSWDGYPAARQRLLDMLAETGVSNPVAIDGDFHAFQVANLNRQANDLTTPIIASEFTTTSISSRGFPQKRLDKNKENNANILLSDSRHRGYLLLDFASDRLGAELIATSDQRRVLARFEVADGKPGPVRL